MSTDPNLSSYWEAGAAGTRCFLVAALALVATFALVGFRLRPPAAANSDAPAREFSAARAEAVLARLLAEGRPRPSGSEANAAGRERVITELRAIGLEPQVQETFVCSRASCATVVNVVARVEGLRRSPAVLLATHHDSVGAGPGASDDLASVAALVEVARALRAEPPLEHPIVLLVDDGEEIGLLGARAFAAEHPWAGEVGAVVNLEARGTTGPSFLFETSADNGWLIESFARHAARPATSSIFYSVYRRLPNDTDLTVFKARRWSGVNFAFIGGVPRYHTPLDDLAHLDRRSLQHQGQNALAALRGLTAAQLAPPAATAEPAPRRGAVYFDLLTALVVRWPVVWTLPLALVAFLLVAGATLVAGRAGRDASGLRPLSRPLDLLDRLTVGGALLGWLGAVAALAAAWGSVWAALYLLRRLGALPVDWPASLGLLAVLVWTLAALSALIVGRWFAARAGTRALWTGWWLFAAAAGIALAVADPSVAYVVIVPALAAGAGGLYGGWRFGGRGLGSPLAVLLPVVAQALVLAPFAWALQNALGVPILPVLAVLSALLVVPLLVPLAAVESWSRSAARWMPIGLGVAAAGLLIAVALAEPLTADVPQRLTLRLHRDATAVSSHWIVAPESGVVPTEMAGVGRFGSQREAILPWSRGADGFRAPAGDAGADLAPPELEVLAATASTLRLRLRSPRGAPIVGLALPAGLGARVEAARMNGRAFESIGKGERPADGWRFFLSWTTPPEGVVLELALAAPPPSAARPSEEAVIYDQSGGLPGAAQELLRARPATAVPSGWGDATLVSRRVSLTVDTATSQPSP